MAGCGVGVVAVVRSLQDAGLSVTLVRGSELDRELFGNPALCRQLATPRTQTYLSRHCESSHKSLLSKQVKPEQQVTSKGEFSLDNSLFKSQMDRSCSPIKTEELFDRSCDRRSCRNNSPCRYPYTSKGSMFTTPSKEMELFTSSLRRYPHPATPTDGSRSAELVERILTYTQAKNYSRRSYHAKNVFVKKKNSSETSSSKNSTDTTRNKLKHEIPTKEASFKTHNGDCTPNLTVHNDNRNRSSSHKSKFKAEAKFAYTYDYLTKCPYGTEVRYFNELTNYIKNLGKPRCNCNVSTTMCPKMQNRYNHHVKEHHKVDTGQDMCDEECTPADVKCNECVVIESCNCDDDTPDDEYESKIDRIVDLWHHELPVYSNECPLDTKCRENMIEELKENLKKLKHDKEVIEKSIKEIKDCTQALPFWLPGSPEEEAKFKASVAYNLIENLGLLDTDETVVRKIIAEWVNNLPFDKVMDKKDVIQTIYDKLQPLLNDKENNKNMVYDKIKDELIEVLKALPLKLDSEDEIYKLVESLANHLITLDEKQVENVESNYDNETKTIRNVILHGLKDIPEFFSISIPEINKIKDLVGNISNTLEEIKKENKGDIQHKIENKVEEWFDNTLENTLKRTLDPRRKKKILEKIKQELRTIPSVADKSSDKTLGQKQIHKIVTQWQKDTSQIQTGSAPEDQRNVQNLTSKLQEIVDKKGVNDYTKKELATEVSKWLDVTVDHGIIDPQEKTVIAEKLVNKIVKQVKLEDDDNGSNKSELKKSKLSEKIFNWFDRLPLAAQCDPEENEKLVKKISKKIKDLKSNDHEDEIKDEVKNMLERAARKSIVQTNPDEIDRQVQSLLDITSQPSQKERKRWSDKNKILPLQNKINEVIDSLPGLSLNKTKRDKIKNKIFDVTSKNVNVDSKQITDIITKEYPISKKDADRTAKDIIDKVKQILQFNDRSQVLNKQSKIPPRKKESLNETKFKNAIKDFPKANTTSNKAGTPTNDKIGRADEKYSPSRSKERRRSGGVFINDAEKKVSFESKENYITPPLPITPEGLKHTPETKISPQINENNVNMHINGVLNNSNVDPRRRKNIEKKLNDILAEQIILGANKNDTEKIVASVLEEANLRPDETASITHEIVSKVYNLSRNITEPTQYFSQMQESSVSPAHKTSLSTSLLSQIVGNSMRKEVNDILDNANIDPRSRIIIEHKLNDVLADQVMRGDIGNDTKNLVSSVLEEANLEPNETSKISDEIAQRINNLSHNLKEPSRYAETQEFSPYNKVSSKMPMRAPIEIKIKSARDNFITSTPKKGHRVLALVPEEFDSFLSGRPSISIATKPLEEQYKKRISEIIGDWIEELPINLDATENEKVKDAMVRDLADNIVDRKKYLQVNPSAKTSNEEEVKHLKYQLFRWLNKIVDERELPDAMDQTENVIKNLTNVPVPGIVRSSFSYHPSQPTYNESSYKQPSTNERDLPFNSQPSQPIYDKAKYQLTERGQQPILDQSGYGRPQMAQSSYGSPDIDFTGTNKPRFIQPNISQSSYIPPNIRNADFGEATTGHAEPQLAQPDYQWDRFNYGPRNMEQPGYLQPRDDPGYTQPKIHQPEFSQTYSPQSDYDQSDVDEYDQASHVGTWAPILDSTEFIEENIEGVVSNWLDEKPFYKNLNAQNKRKLKQIAPVLAKEIKNLLAADDVTYLDEQMINNISNKLRETPLDMNDKSRNHVAQELLDHLKGLNLFGDISAREELMSEREKTPNKQTSVFKEKGVSQDDLSPVEFGFDDDIEQDERDESEDEDIDINTTIRSHINVGISNWLQDLPAYKRSDSTEKRQQERALSDLIENIKDVFHDVYTSDKERIPSKIFDQEIEKHLQNVLASDTPIDDDIVKTTIDQLKNHIRTMQSGERRDPFEYLQTVVYEWSDALPLIKRKNENDYNDKKSQFLSLIKQLRQNIEMPKVLYDVKLNHAIKSYLESLPIDGFKKRDNKFIETKTKKLMDTLNVVPLGQKKCKKSVDESLLGLNEREAADYLKDFINMWCDELPIKAETQKEKDDAKQLKQYLVKKLISKIVELNLDPETADNDLLYKERLKEACANLTSILPECPELTKYLPVHIEDLVNTVNDAKNKTLEELADKIYRQQIIEAINRTLPLKEDLTLEQQSSFEVFKDDLADAYINLHHIIDDKEFKDKVRQMIRREIDKFGDDYLSRYPNSPLDTEQLKEDLFRALQSVVPPAEISLRSESEHVRVKEIIKDWVDELPLKKMEGTDAVMKNKMISMLAKEIQEKEDEETNDPNLDLTEEKRKGIKDWLQKMPLKISDKKTYDKMTTSLLNKLKDKKIYPPPSQLSEEDQIQMQKIKDRARDRSPTELTPDVLVKEHEWGTDSSIRDTYGSQQRFDSQDVCILPRRTCPLKRRLACSEDPICPGLSQSIGSGKSVGVGPQESCGTQSYNINNIGTNTEGSDTCKCEPCCQKRRKKDAEMTTEYRSAYNDEDQMSAGSRCFCRPQHAQTDAQPLQKKLSVTSSQASNESIQGECYLPPCGSPIQCKSGIGRRTIISTKICKPVLRPCDRGGRQGYHIHRKQEEEDDDKDVNNDDNRAINSPCSRQFFCPPQPERTRPCLIQSGSRSRSRGRKYGNSTEKTPVCQQEPFHGCRQCGKCPYPSHLYFRR